MGVNHLSAVVKPAASKEDAHVPPGAVDLTGIMCLEYERTVTNDYVIRCEGRLFQILKTCKALPKPKSKVAVRVGL